MTRTHRRLTTTAVLTGLAVVAWPPLARAQQPQPITVSGTVTNETGQPMQGASVALVGLGLGAMTGEDGKYSFIVPAARATGQAATLDARRLGYRPVQFAVTLTPGINTVCLLAKGDANPVRDENKNCVSIGYVR